MQKYFNYLTNGQKPVAGAKVTVTGADGKLAVLYADNGTLQKANPVLTDAKGYFEFYVANGRYNLTFSGARVELQTITDVLISDATGTTIINNNTTTTGGGAAGGTSWEREIVATANQTVFTVPEYTLGGDHLEIAINGINQQTTAYSESTTTSFTFNEGLSAGDVVKVLGFLTGNTTVPPATTPSPSLEVLDLVPISGTAIGYLGDSTVWGSDGAAMDGGATRVANPAPAVMDAALTNYTVGNEGISGNNMKKVWLGQDGQHPAFTTWVASTPYKYLILNNGINDTYSLSLSEYTGYLNQIVDAARNAGKVIILETPNETDDSSVDAFRAAMRQVATDKSVPLIDQDTYLRNYRSTNGLGIYDMYPDGYHPNQATYTLKGNYAATRFAAILAGSPAPVPTPNPPPPTTSDNTKPYGRSETYGAMTFQEEFSGTSLNTAKWNKSLWYEADDPVQNFDVTGSYLRIWPEYPFVNRTIDTDGKFSQIYGYFEARLKLPIGKGVWPAFWLYGHYEHGNIRDRPEIDMMEAYPGGGTGGGWGDANLHPINYGFTIHKANADYSEHESFGEKMSDQGMSADLSADFHVYGVRWTPSVIQFTFDGADIGPAFTNDGYWDQPMYLLLDIWFGADSGNPDSSTPTGSNNSLLVDYVRAWEL